MSKHRPIIINGRSVKPGEHAELYLNQYRIPTRTIIDLPVYVYRAEKEGPVLLLMAGMHGDEVNGVETLRKLIRGRTFEKLLSGSVIVIPIVNIISFLAGTRDMPDGKDLNRLFPGSTSGSLGSRIAHDLVTQILPQIDFGIDFHTGGARINNYPQIRCVFNDKVNLELSKQFAPPFIINAPTRDKTFRKVAAEIGKQILVFEGGESNRFNKLSITEGINGCLRMMNALGMIQTDTPAQHTIVLNDSTWIRASVSGMFRTTKKYGTFFEKNEVIGTISDPYGETEVELKAPYEGFIVGINNQPVIHEGDALIHIGRE